MAVKKLQKKLPPPRGTRQTRVQNGLLWNRMLRAFVHANTASYAVTLIVSERGVAGLYIKAETSSTPLIIKLCTTSSSEPAALELRLLDSVIQACCDILGSMKVQSFSFTASALEETFTSKYFTRGA